MKKIIEIYKKNKVIDYIIIIIVAVILSIQLYKVKIFFGTHDGTCHFFRINNTIKTLKNLQFPPIVSDNTYNNQGYAMNLFYPPITTYLSIFINIFTYNVLYSMKIFASFMIIISGIAMYSMTYQIVKKRHIALISGLLYIMMPYCLGNIYVRFAMGEFTALAFMPLVFLGLYNLFNQDGERHYYIAIGATLMFLSHTITTFYFAVLCFIYLLFNIKRICNKEIIKKLLIILLFIVILTTMFWGPLLEANYTADYAIFDDELMYTNNKMVAFSTIDLEKLILGEGEQKATMSFIGIPVLFLMILSLYCFKKVDKSYKKTYVFFLICSIFLLLMITKLFPWKNMPNILCKMQFSWRLIGILSLFANFICAINLDIITNKIIKNIDFICIFIISFFIIYIIYNINLLNIYICQEGENDLYVAGFFNEYGTQITNIIRDYYPKKTIIAQDDYHKLLAERESKIIIQNGSAYIKKIDRKNLNFILYMENIEANTKIEFPLIFYPGYVAFIDVDGVTKRLDVIESEDGFAAINISNNYDDAIIELKYKGTLVTKKSYATSAISLVVFIIYVIKVKKYNKLNLDKK